MRKMATGSSPYRQGNAPANRGVNTKKSVGKK